MKERRCREKSEKVKSEGEHTERGREEIEKREIEEIEKREIEVSMKIRTKESGRAVFEHISLSSHAQIERNQRCIGVFNNILPVLFLFAVSGALLPP